MRPLTSALLATICASSLALVDESVVNVALASIGQGLTASTAALQWTIDAYRLPLSALLLFSGSAGDRFGHRRMLLLGTALFTAMSLLAAVAPNVTTLLISRLLQGVGGAAIIPNSLAALIGASTPQNRDRAVGIWVSAGSIAMMVGPPLGGWLTGAFGWRSVFLVNVPLAAAAFALSLRLKHDDVGGKSCLDVPGALLVTGALALLAFGLIIWSEPHHNGVEPSIAIISALALLVILVTIEGRREKPATLPVDLFRRKGFAGIPVATFLLYGPLAGLLTVLPYTLVVACKLQPSQAGAALLAYPIAFAIFSRLVGRWSNGSSPNRLVILGAVVVAAAYGLLGASDPRTQLWSLTLPSLVVIAGGMACLAGPLIAAVAATTPDDRTGVAMGLTNTSVQVGGLVAVAATGWVLGRTGEALLSAMSKAAWLAAFMALIAGAAGHTIGNAQEMSSRRD